MVATVAWNILLCDALVRPSFFVPLVTEQLDKDPGHFVKLDDMPVAKFVNSSSNIEDQILNCKLQNFLVQLFVLQDMWEM